jgi:hypothetical protein
MFQQRELDAQNMDGLLGCSGSTQGVTVAGLETARLPVVARTVKLAIKKPNPWVHAISCQHSGYGGRTTGFQTKNLTP